MGVCDKAFAPNVEDFVTYEENENRLSHYIQFCAENYSDYRTYNHVKPLIPPNVNVNELV